MKLKKLSESLRRSWASWVALGISVVVMLGVVVVLIQMFRESATVDWIEEKGGSVTYSPGWLSRELPAGTRSWLDKRLGGPDWSKPFDMVTSISLSSYKKTTDADLNRLRRLNSLQILDLNYNTQITDGRLAHLKGMKTLQGLNLVSAPITDAGLAHLDDLTELDALFLNDIRITDAGLVHLRRMNRLGTLSLANTKVTDAGLVHLKGMHSMDILFLPGTHVTDAGLVHLHGLKALALVDLRRTPVTDAGVGELKRKAPKLANVLR